MGSKRKLAPKIVDFILKQNPECEYVYDLFGGGGAISFEFLQREQIKDVYYNELNTGVVELLRKIQKDGVTYDFFQFIDRETFQNHKNDADWFGGLCKVVWSFGNNQKDYLFGKDIAEYKKNFHLVVANGDNRLKEMVEYCHRYVLDKYGIDHYPKLTMPTKKDYQERRLEIRKQLTIYEKECKEKRNTIKSIRQLQQLQQLERLEQLQQLERLERLQRLQRLERLERLHILNLSYDDVKIETPVDKTVVYLDPPYIGEASYQEKIDYEDFYRWVKSSPYKIYISSYESSFYEVASFDHRTTFRMNAGDSNKKTKERLFCNVDEEVKKPVGDNFLF